MRKNNVKTISPKGPKGDAKLSKQEQDRINKQWESTFKEKLDGRNARIDQTAYDAWVKSGKKGGAISGVFVNDSPSTPKQKPEPVTAKLPTRKLTSTPISNSIVKQKAAKTVKEEAPKFEPTPGTKKLTKGSGSRTGNVGTAIRNVVGKQVFKSEAKKAAAYKRATSAVGTGSLAGMSKQERASELKGQMKDLKAAKKTNKTDVRAEMKDTKKAIKWSNKVGSNKNQYLNIYGKKK